MPAPAAAIETREATLKRIKWERPGNAWKLLQMTNGQTWKGAVGDVLPGAFLKAKGVEVTDDYGLAFEVQELVSSVLKGAAGVEAWLTYRMPEIGAVRARAMVERFGEGLGDVILRDSMMLTSVPGITVERAADIQKAYASYQDELAWVPRLVDNGLQMAHALAAFKAHGVGLEQVLAEDPYTLVDVEGLSFEVVDALARRLGMHEKDPRRMRAWVRNLLEEDLDEGHCNRPLVEVIVAIAKWGLPAREVIDLLKPSKHLWIEEKSISLARVTYAERRVAEGVRALVARGQREPGDVELPESLDASQRAAALALLVEPIVVMTGGPGCHAKGQRLLRADGSLVAVEDVRPGDTLMGPSGPKFVLELRRGHGRMVKIVPVKGTPFVVNEDHVLTVVHSVKNVVEDLTVNEFKSRVKKYQDKAKLFRAPVERFEDEILDSELSIDPYFLGVLLGDGQLGPSIIVSKPDEAIREACAEAARAFGLNSRVNEAGRCVQFHLSKKSLKGRPLANPLITCLRELNLFGTRSGTKFIPQMYKTASREARLQLFAGLVDTDGHMSRGYALDYASKSQVLAEDFVFVARSLGFAAYMRPKQAYCQTGGGGTYYRVSVSGDLSEVPTRIPRRKASVRRQKKSVLRTGFTIEPAAEADFYGFTLNGDGRYLLEDFTVTHNSGKTTTLKAALDVIESRGERPVLAAPTGKAAKRMSEVTGRPASTIHRLLGWQPDGWKCGPDAPIAADVVVIDEASMVDLELAAALFDAIGEGTRLILVGDVDQLPPVGAGQPLVDVIRSGAVPVHRLTKTHRQSAKSWVIDNARRIINGDVPSLESDDSFDFVVCADSDGIVAAVVAMQKKFPNVQVLTPEHKKGAGTVRLNNEIQAAVNPRCKDQWASFVESNGCRIFAGDRVIYTRNQLGLVNGDLGVVEDVEAIGNKRTVTVRFVGVENPDPESVDGLFRLRDGNVRPLQLAYALTVHKFQGSEHPEVVVVADEAHWSFRRQLLYTAVTRTSDKLGIVGSREAVARAVAKPRDTNRRTRLVERIGGAT